LYISLFSHLYNFSIYHGFISFSILPRPNSFIGGNHEGRFDHTARQQWRIDGLFLQQSGPTVARRGSSRRRLELCKQHDAHQRFLYLQSRRVQIIGVPAVATQQRTTPRMAATGNFLPTWNGIQRDARLAHPPKTRTARIFHVLSSGTVFARRRRHAVKEKKVQATFQNIGSLAIRFEKGIALTIEKE